MIAWDLRENLSLEALLTRSCNWLRNYLAIQTAASKNECLQVNQSDK
jgi:hypothetical protein